MEAVENRIHVVISHPLCELVFCLPHQTLDDTIGCCGQCVDIVCEDDEFLHENDGCIPYREIGEDCHHSLPPGVQYRCREGLECQTTPGLLGASGTCGEPLDIVCEDDEFLHDIEGCLPYREVGEDCHHTTSPGTLYRYR
eukprot:UN00174